jgi:hypothetical protein
MSADLNRRMIARAAELLGGEEQLARHLGVSTTRLFLWSAGAEKPPLSAFLRLADVLIDSSLRAIIMHSTAASPSNGEQSQPERAPAEKTAERQSRTR